MHKIATFGSSCARIEKRYYLKLPQVKVETGIHANFERFFEAPGR